MAEQTYSLNISVKVADESHGRKTAVVTSFKDPQQNKEHEHKVLVPAPPSQSRVTQAIHESLKLFIDRGLGLVDVSKFKSQYDAAEVSTAENKNPGDPVFVPSPNAPAKDADKDAAKDGKAPAAPSEDKKPAPAPAAPDKKADDAKKDAPKK